MAEKKFSKKGVLIACALVVLVAAVYFGGTATGFITLGKQPVNKVMFIGVDCATWDIMNPMIERGELPNFKYAMDNGAYSTLWSMQPMLSPRIWTTMMTGQQPNDHGILGFVVENSTRPGGAEFYTSSMRKTSAIWNSLSEEGASVGIVSYLVTWPAEDVNGFIVTERAMDPHEKNATWPPGLKEEVREIVDGHIEELRGNAVREGRRDEFSTVVGLELEEKYEPDLFIVYYRQIDGACHTYIDRNYTKVEETYRYIDHTMGQLLAAADDDTTIFIVSDHGCGHGDQSKKGQGINWTLSQHRENGIIIVMGPGIRSGYEMGGDYSAMDMGPTLFYAMGLPIGMDMEGKVIEDMFEPSYLNKNPFTFIDTYDTEGPRNTETPVEGISDEAELERLRALGYLN